MLRHIAALCVAMASSLANAESVFRCETPGEPPLFSDLPCPDATAFELPTVPLIQSVGVESIDFGSSGAPSTGRSSGTAAKRTGRGSGRFMVASRAERCEDARVAMRNIQMKRRKGYSIAEGAQLEAQMREEKEAIRSNCR